VAVEIESTAWKLGANIGPGAKVQKLLDAMHPILKRAVEPHNKREDQIYPERWDSIVEDAELQDDILYSTQAYDAKREKITGTKPKTGALESTNRNNWQPKKPKWQNSNRKQGTFGNNPTTKKAGKTCFYCAKTGHFIKECRKKKRDQEGGREQFRTAVVQVGQQDSTKKYSSFKEYQQSKPINKASTSAIGPRNNDMVTTLRINNRKAKVLFDTGTTGTNLLSNAFFQTNGIQRKAMQPPVIIRLATKGSKTVAKDQVTCTVEIAPQIKVKTQFLVVPIKEYQAIMGMPFLQQHEVKLNMAKGTAIFGKHCDYVIRCNKTQSAAILVTAAAGTNEETVTLPDFTKEFPNVFPEREPEGLPPLQKGCNHKIRIVERQRGEFKKRYVKIVEAWKDQARAFIAKWRSQGIAVPGTAFFACPTFAVLKPGKKGSRWVHNLRERNKITERDCTEIPLQWQMLESAAQAKCLSVLDLADVYHQIRMDPEFEQYNTTSVLGATNEIRVMLQGDANAPATMMRNRSTIFRDIIGEYVWVYLDDVVVFSQSVQEHMQYLREIFKRLQNVSFYLKLNKCQLMQKSIKLLGSTIENGKITPAPEKIRRIMDCKIPKTKKQLQAFIELVNNVAPHLLHAATVTAPLTELTGSSAEWNWDHLHRQAFNQLKFLSETHAPIRPLNYKDAKSGNTNVYLVTDASSVGTGAAICHGNNYENAKSNIAALHSRKFTQAQIAYHTTDQEYLAVVDALKAFETRLLGILVTVITDHQALVHMMNQEISSPQQMKWMNYVLRFEFRIQHQPGRTIMLADALSRLYEDIPKDRIGTEEMADGINGGEDNELSEEYLNIIEFPADEEIGRELNLEDEAKRTYPFKTPSIARTLSFIPHVMAKAEQPLSKKCRPGINYRF
jgi:hypothetical protein